MSEALELELAKYKRAIQIARDRGEHYPVCNAPPRDVMKDLTTWKAWRDVNRGKCDCWKAQMEEALK